METILRRQGMRRGLGMLLVLFIAFHQIAIAGQTCPNYASPPTTSDSSHASHQHHSPTNDLPTLFDGSSDALADLEAHCAQVDESLPGKRTLDSEPFGSVALAAPAYWSGHEWGFPRNHPRVPPRTVLPPAVPIAIFLHRLRD